MAKNWIKTATKRMKQQGTEGSFTAIAKREGGYDEKNKRIKKSFIEKATHSKNPAVRKKANFAKNIRKSYGAKMLKNIYRPTCDNCKKPMCRNGFRYNKTHREYVVQYACLACKKWRLELPPEKTVACPTCNSQLTIRTNADNKTIASV